MTTESKKEVDYGDDAAPEITVNILATLDVLANQAMDVEAEIDDLNAKIKVANERQKDLLERQIPEVMAEARQKAGITTESNLVVKVENKVRASLPKEDLRKRAAAMQWLREQGHGAHIRTVINIPFEAGRDPAAEGLQKFLILLSRSDMIREAVIKFVQENNEEDWPDLAPAFAFLGAIGNVADQRVFLDSTVHHSTLAALVRELLEKGKIDQTGMDTIGAFAWKEASVKRKD